MPDITHTPSIGGSAYAGCAPMWVVIQHVADGHASPRAHALVADHDVTLRLQLAGYRFPRFNGRVTPEGQLEEVREAPTDLTAFSEWARTTL